MRNIRSPFARAVAVRRGFSLIEILVVLAILSLALVIGSQASRSVQRAALDSTAGNIRSFVQRASTEMKMRGHTVFVVVDRSTTGSLPWQIALWEDTNDNRLWEAGSDTLVQTYTVPNNITLSTAAETGQIESTGWSDNGADTTARYLGCDSLSRTITRPPAQIQTAATLAITLRRMLPPNAPDIGPSIECELRISPVWGAAIQRLRWNPATSKFDVKL